MIKKTLKTNYYPQQCLVSESWSCQQRNVRLRSQDEGGRGGGERAGGREGVGECEREREVSISHRKSRGRSDNAKLFQ